MTLLTKIQSYCQEAIEKFSSAYNLNIEIIDNELRYIGAVGRYFDRINDLIPSIGGRLTIKVLSMKKEIYVDDPQNHPICSECYNLANCIDRVEICYPIIYNDISLGVISIASANFEQAEMIKNNRETFMLSVSLLASTIQEHAGNYDLQKELAKGIEINSLCLNAIPEGAIVFKNNSNIIQMNSHSEKTLGYTMAQIPYLEKINQIKVSFQKSSDSFDECQVKIRGKEIVLRGRLLASNKDGGSFASLFVFGDICVSKDFHCSFNQPIPFTFASLIGKNPAFLLALEESKKQAFSNTCFLLWGEVGVGKERLARTIHTESTRRERNFIKIAGNNDFIDLFQELFNYAKPEDKKSRSLLNNDMLEGSTIYIDEVGSLDQYNQEKLLSLLSNANYFNFKIILSSTCDLKSLVNRGEFIRDLYHALELNSVYLAPLRQRGEDIILLAQHYLKKYNLFHKKNLYFSRNIIEVLSKYSWRGNIIELENAIGFTVQAHDDVGDEITLDNIPENLKKRLWEGNQNSFNLENSEKEMIIKALNELGGSGNSKKLVAEKLGISISTLYRKLKYYNISSDSSYL